MTKIKTKYKAHLKFFGGFIQYISFVLSFINMNINKTIIDNPINQYGAIVILKLLIKSKEDMATT
jgi:hypothetical protein